MDRGFLRGRRPAPASLLSEQCTQPLSYPQGPQWQVDTGAGSSMLVPSRSVRDKHC